MLPEIYYTGEQLAELIKLCDAIEVSGVQVFEDPRDPESTFCERVSDDSTPDFFSVYGHYATGGCECIADFATENAALLYANGFSLPVHRG